MSDIKINTSEVRAIADRLDSKKEQIMNVYKNKLIPLIESSEDCLKVSSLSYDEVINSFNSVFNSLDQRMNELTSVLKNKIIPEYENAAGVIRNSFNNTFADEMRSILSSMTKE